MTPPKKISSAVTDIITISLIGIALLGLAIQFNLFEKFLQFLLRYRGYYFEDIVFVLIVLSMFFAVFSYRRWREAEHEISKRIKSEEARKISEQRSSAVLTSIPNLTFRIRRDGTYLDFRAGNPDDLLMPTEHLIGSTVMERLPAVIAKQYMAGIERALTTDTIQTFEYDISSNGIAKKFETRIIASGADEVFVLIRNITNSKLISEALAASETRFKAVVESLNEGLILTDLHDAIVYVNQRMTDLCGWTIDELRNKPASEFFIPRSQWAVHAERNERRKNGVAERYQIEMLRKNGTTFWAEIYGSPYRDITKTIIGSIGIVTDITEQRRNEQLQSALFRITSISRSASDMHDMFAQLHTIIGELMYAKNFYVALYDRVTDMISFPYFVDEVDAAAPPRKFSHGSTEYILSTGNILHAPEPVFNELSSEGVVELIGAQAVDWLGIPLKHEGVTFGVLAIQSYDPNVVFSDREKEILVFVSEHIASAIQQRSDEERFRAVWEHSSEGMRVTNKEGMIVMVNKAFCDLVKKPKEELIGKSFQTFYQNSPDGIQSAIETYRHNFINNSIPQRVESDVVLWNGEKVAIEMSTSYITSDINERMLLSIFRNVTDRKQLEDQLLHAQKMDSIGVLAGGIAHDFNNVLAMILGSAEIVKHKAKDQPDILKFANMIAAAAERGSGIAKQLLMFARTEKGMLRPLSLTAVVQDVSKLLEHSIPKSIAITTRGTTADDVIIGNEDQLHQIIINLALNSRDAILERDPHGGTLSFTISSVHGKDLKKQFPGVRDELYAALDVQDNGTGMTEETLQRIFEPFFSTKERGKGTGLGLSIVHGIMKYHNGVIDVKSTPGAGTTFRLFFPATYVSDRPATKEPAPVYQSRDDDGARCRKIMVVDDEAPFRSMLKDYFESHGYGVLTANDGNDAIAVFDRHKDDIALVISDYGMPNANGEEFLRHVKNDSPTTPFILMTGYATLESKELMTKSGADDFLLKPFKVDAVMALVRKFTEKQ